MDVANSIERLEALTVVEEIVAEDTIGDEEGQMVAIMTDLGFEIQKHASQTPAGAVGGEEGLRVVHQKVKDMVYCSRRFKLILFYSSKITV